jgi:oligoendopeptidase F
MRLPAQLLASALLFLSVPALGQGAKERSEIDDQYKWDLTSFYSSDEAWEDDFEALDEMLPDAAQFKGRLTDGGAVLLEAIKKKEAMSELAGNLYVFSGLKSYEDQRVGKYSGMFSRARSMYANVNEAWAFFSPELLAMPEDRLWDMVDRTDGLAIYRHYFDEILRARPHTLTESEEKILAKASDPMAKFNNVFSAIDNADLTFGTILDEEGAEVELTKGRYNAFLRSQDRRVRRDAWIGLFEEYDDLGNTLAANYEGHVKSRIFFADVRNHDSALEASLFSNAIPTDVYTNLVATARENAEPLQRFMELRRRELGVDTLQVWDLYAPVVEPVWQDVPWEDAREIVARGLEPLGQEYLNLYHQGFDERWVDVYENRGKRGGAYAWGTYTSLPYLSMNYQGTLTDVFTLAHEYGHSLHRWLTTHNQPYVYGSNRIFIAEVASMTNEALLIQKMLREATDRTEKLALLEHYLDRFRAAFYRQISFADFEMQAHALVENGQPLTKETLDGLYADVFDAYYGDAVHAHPLNAAEWSRIPHFMRTDNFYVYQYATSFAAATALAKRILDEGQPAVDRFLALLKSGTSDYSIEMLKKAGIDMTTPQPILDTVAVFDALVGELEATLAMETVESPQEP